MTETSDTLCIEKPTQHAMLVAWGHFGQEIGLVEQLRKVPIEQKTVVRQPYEKVVEFLIGLLSGIEYLSDLSEGAAPLMRDGEVAAAWGLEQLADASGVSRTLKACDEKAVAAIEEGLEEVTRPFRERAIADLIAQDKEFVLDADLTGRPVSSSSETFPGAAFGYMDGEIRLGYQLAEICIQTDLYGRQWLGARHHPGNTVSAECLLELIELAEQRLGCHPYRRTDLLAQRLATSQEKMVDLKERAQKPTAKTEREEERMAHLTQNIQQGQVALETLRQTARSARQKGPYSRLSKLQKKVRVWEAQCERAQDRLERAHHTLQRYQARILALETEINQLQERYERFCRENVAQPIAPRFRVRLDAGFSSGENLTDLLESGYAVDTKSANDALVKALQKRAGIENASWTRVGKNAEMIGWTDYQISSCPYPLTVGLERFHTPKGTLHSVLIHPPVFLPDLPSWFREYNSRQTIEAGNKEEKTTFKVQHLMCRSPAGIRIQALLTVFAANFVRWARLWVPPHIPVSNRRFDRTLSSTKRLVRIAANSPADILHFPDHTIIRFSHLSSFSGVIINLPVQAFHTRPSNDIFSHF